MAMTLDGTNGAFLPTWTTATRPASPSNGEIGYNSTTGQLDQYVGGAWSSIPTGSASAATPTALGTVYGKQTTSGGTPYLTAYGYNAGTNNTGANNTAVGVDALTANTSGAKQTAVGHLALTGNTTGTENTGVGYGALYSNNANYNTAIGNQTLQATTSGANNVAVGYQAGYSNSTSANNTYSGYQAGYFQTGNDNVAVGKQAMYGASGSSGTNNVGVGRDALLKVTSGYNNVCVGNAAGQNITTGLQNNCFGLGAGGLLTTGQHNICIGRSAGENTGPDTGSSNLLIGYDARASTGAASQQLVIASIQSATAKGDNTGFMYPGTGGMYQGNNSASWSTTSDRRLKKNIVDNTEGLDKVTQIRVRNFEYRTVEEVTELPEHTVIKKEGVQLGVIAQELQEICPDCVKEESTGVISVDSDNIFWHMVNAIKELKTIVDAQAAEIAELKTKA